MPGEFRHLLPKVDLKLHPKPDLGQNVLSVQLTETSIERFIP